MTDKPEQPNTELMIIKTIQGLISAVNRELGKLYVNKLDEITYQRQAGRKAKAIEEIDLFEKTTLFELQKAFE